MYAIREVVGKLQLALSLDDPRLHCGRKDVYDRWDDAGQNR